MTACVLADGTGVRAPVVGRRGFTVAAGGGYAACLADAGEGCWYPERWTMDGPEPYAVALPGNQPEEPDAQVVPMADGRVLIRRRVAARHDLALLYPAGPGTGELPLGSLPGPDGVLLPPPPGPGVWALTGTAEATTVWLVDPDDEGGPRARARVPGRCTGGVWLDRAGRLLALDREADGRTKTVVVDLATAEVTPLLQITEDSDDRLLLADPDSGLLLVRSDAPGSERIGWGVLGSRQPVRFPEALRGSPEEDRITPLAAQPGRSLTPGECAVVLAVGDSAVLWRPDARATLPLPTPPGWLPGGVRWSSPDRLRLPYSAPEQPCGVRELGPQELAFPVAPEPGPEPGRSGRRVMPLQQAPLAAVGRGPSWPVDLVRR
ncbi:MULTISPECIES: hypothetical protein [Streptomycetaceae]|uniref:Uncharacterized protein n=1 Tax=Streptantibioticus cattleyicolor (strain ATCC 35852 / DSM 46488 / JCM 4925 / NBRC 14057 / NRRL 8057) TaxID=1003195 RepID=F8K351_STREN|nr:MULTISPECIES: hypothetical protein [Streptomycetaceae]AEW93763.1 hypothetical protein SCATT_13920 [Streptantibioticus cattleyicolor NRRL 8057 = DSM 46488]MYS58451.1 hypothetical protein [Streptomyces sp. SID5468]CCB74110.1 conserved protein of unknown function [Streptantibioticus cattleyicolor NRRL 8057 = DSM 46488]